MCAQPASYANCRSGFLTVLVRALFARKSLLAPNGSQNNSPWKWHKYSRSPNGWRPGINRAVHIRRRKRPFGRRNLLNALKGTRGNETGLVAVGRSPLLQQGSDASASRKESHFDQS